MIPCRFQGDQREASLLLVLLDQRINLVVGMGISQSPSMTSLLLPVQLSHVSAKVLELDCLRLEPISSHRTSSPLTTISFIIVLAKASSTPFNSFNTFSSRESSSSGDMSSDIETEIGGTSAGSCPLKSGADADRACCGGASRTGLVGRTCAFERPRDLLGGCCFRRGGCESTYEEAWGCGGGVGAGERGIHKSCEGGALVPITGAEKSIRGASRRDAVSPILARFVELMSMLPARLDVGLGFRKGRFGSPLMGLLPCQASVAARLASTAAAVLIFVFAC
jgi:hypothetical protein